MLYTLLIEKRLCYESLILRRNFIQNNGTWHFKKNPTIVRFYFLNIKLINTVAKGSTFGYNTKISLCSIPKRICIVAYQYLL